MKNVIIFILLLSFGWYSCKSDNDQLNSKEENTQIDGNALYKKNCIICHGIDGKLQYNGAKDLSKSMLNDEERIKQITNGKKLMTPFGGILSEREIKAVAEFTKTLNPLLK